MRKLVTIKFGSHLYGTTTPSSDLDFKSVYIPSARDILLQSVKGSINKSRKKAEKEKNLPGEIEEESYSLQKYLELASQGQTVALDILFAPEWSMIEPPTAEWREVLNNRTRLLSTKSAVFISYCQKQAAKYGIKGSRVAAARIALRVLNALVYLHGSTPKLGQFESEIAGASSCNEHMTMTDISLPNGTTVRHWDVCGRKMPFTASIKNARDVTQRLVDEYGQRALAAETNQGIDWKALSHAVRVGTQAIELLQTGNITFPLPNAAHVLAIKTGQLSYQEVSAEIEQLLAAIETEAQTSALPAEPDREWMTDFIVQTYRAEVCRD